ncbi:MAG: hypothetical protein HOI95_05220 [Chromatiales bacterium]|nr:hypothetical protein [Chromatiales bacterium]
MRASSAWVPGFVRGIYQANFGHDADIASANTIAACLEEVNADSKVIMREAQTSESKELLRSQTKMAAEIGIFGAPSFLVDGELFWGGDRLIDALRWARDTPRSCT